MLENLDTDSLSPKLQQAIDNAALANKWANVSVKFEISYEDIEFDSSNPTAIKKLCYDIKPVLVVAASDGSVLATDDAPVKNGKKIGFRIPVPATVPEGYAKIEHVHNGQSVETHHVQIQEEDGQKYVYIEVTQFSDFLVTLTNEAPPESIDDNAEPVYYRGSRGRSSSGRKSSSATYSSFWEKDATGAWRVKNKSGQYVLNAWLCDSAIKANGILPYDSNASAEYGLIRPALEKRGELIGPMDMLIAAHAKSRKLTLITNNVREFKRVKGLKIENWVDTV